MSSISTSKIRKFNPLFFLGLKRACGIVLPTMGLSLLFSVYSRSTRYVLFFFLLLRFFSSAYLEKNDSRLTRRQPMWPGMGTEIVFELWKKNTSSSSSSSSSSEAYFIRVLLSGQPLETSTPLGTLDMVPWDEFEKYLNETIPEDIVGMCAQI